MPSITFDESAAETVAAAFDHYFGDDGVLYGDDGYPLEDPTGEVVTYEEFAGYVKIDGEPVPVRDNFVSLVEGVEQSQTEGDDA